MALLHLHVAFRDFSNVLGTVFPPGLVFQSQSFLALPGLSSSNFSKVRGGSFWHNLAIHHRIQPGGRDTKVGWKDTIHAAYICSPSLTGSRGHSVFATPCPKGLQG